MAGTGIGKYRLQRYYVKSYFNPCGFILALMNHAKFVCCFNPHWKEVTIYVFPEMKLCGLVSKIGGPIVEIYKSLTDT
jgi:hypothetical protein